MPSSSGAPTATGTPKPVIPCKKLSKIQPINKTSSSSFGIRLRIRCRITENAPAVWLT